MKKFFLPASFLLLVSFLLPNLAQAVLVPCGTTANNVPCTLCHFIVGFYNLISYGTKILIIVAVTAIIISGIIYIASAGNPKMMQQAKGFLLSVALGCFFFLGAWLIIAVTLKVLTVNYANLGVSGISNWYTFKCDTTSSTPTTK